MTLHALSFSIYMFSTIVTVIAFGLNAWGYISYEIYLMTDIFNIICSSFTQAMMCYIFWNMENIQEPVE